MKQFHYAVKTGNPTLVKMLLADASLQTFSDQTPLEVANQLNSIHMKKIIAVLKEISIKQERPRKYFEKHQYLETTLILTSYVCIGVINSMSF